MIREILNILWPLVAGIVLGFFFYGGLWITIKKGIDSKYAYLLLIGSFFIRTAVVLLGFYYVAKGDWKSMFYCLIGFVLAKFILNSITKKLINKPSVL